MLVGTSVNIHFKCRSIFVYEKRGAEFTTGKQRRRGRNSRRGVRPHPHDLLQDLPVSSGMFDERAGDNAAPKLSGGLSLGPLSSRRIQVSVCGRARKTHLRFTYKGSILEISTHYRWPRAAAPQSAATTASKHASLVRGFPATTCSGRSPCVFRARMWSGRWRRMSANGSLSPVPAAT